MAEREVAERRPLLFYKGMINNKPRAYIYIDGFNLFYGCLKKTDCKWLDISKLSGFYFPKYNILKIKYFSAATKARKNDLDKPVRQQAYFRALKTLANVEIILGTFLESEVKMYVPEKDKNGLNQEVNVSLNNAHAKLPLLGHNHLIVCKTEEKGSDVNLGTNLIIDAYEKKFDVAIVVSNDSDLAEPIRFVNNMTGLKVRLLNPYQKTNFKLQAAVNKDIKIIRNAALKNSQFPDSMKDIIGNFYKPTDWL